MDNIDVQWIIRYLTIMAVLGVSFYFISFCYTLPNRMFTQQWLLFFMIAYATEQILFRPDPWREVRREDVRSMKENSPTLSSSKTIHADRSAFEQWMEAEKPYTNPAFQLMDVRAVLPKNRTYLSQFINTAYGCSFFHLVNRYRIEEAQRLMSEHPNMKLSDVAARCGFSSPAVFSRTFARETGVSPRERKN
jgi:AraC-like DNA-binding protein